MKKNYVKPTMSFESFKMAATFASNCAYNAGATMATCSYTVGGVNYFTSEDSICATHLSGTDYYYPDGTTAGDVMCYYNPTGTSTVFGS